MNLYSEIILDHYKNPRNKGALKGANASARDANPLCGDKIYFYLKVNKQGLIKEARFDGNGCAISMAAASMLADIVAGKKVNEVAKWNKNKIFDLLKVELTPARTKCALLGLNVLHQALTSLKRNNAGLASKQHQLKKTRQNKSFNEHNPFYKILNEITDPDTQIGLADMGLIYDVKRTGKQIKVTMTLTSLGCPAGPHFIDEIEYRLKKVSGVKEVIVEIVWEPLWTPDRIKPELREALGM